MIKTLIREVHRIVESYQTPDGEMFKTLAEATKHEADLKARSINKVGFWFPVIGDTWYKAKDEEELAFLKDYLAKTYGKRYGENRLKAGEWFTVFSYEREPGNMADHFVPLSKLKDDYAALIDLLEKGE